MVAGPRVASEPRRAPVAELVTDPAVLAVAGLTIVGFLLRLELSGQSLFGDELYTYEVAIQHRLADVFTAMERTEANPPLYYLLSWVAAKIADPTVSIKVPSLVMGTATIPAVYLLGRQIGSRAGALMAAALVVVAPLAVFYSSEARAYSALMLFVCVSTFALLRALDDPRLRWWALFAVSTSAALYSHYTAVFPLAAQAVWALWAYPRHRGQILLALAAVALSYLPWLPSVRGTGIGVVGALSELTPGNIASNLVRALLGNPFVSLSRAPGTFALVLAGLAAFVVLGGLGSALVRRGGRVGLRQGDPLTLVALVAVAAPVGVLLSSVVGTNILLPRNFLSSLPAFLVLAGQALAFVERPAGAVALVLLLVALSIGTAKTLGDDLRRPPYNEAAHFIDRSARPTDPVVEYHPAPPSSASAAFFPFQGAFDRHFEVNLDRPHPRFFETANPRAPLWGRVDRAQRAFVVMQWLPSFRTNLPRLRRLRLVERHVWSGSIPIAVLSYAPRAP